jgi:hypothetical protein
VAEALGPAVITDVAIAAEGSGAPGLDGAHGPALGAVEAVGAPKGRAGDATAPAAGRAPESAGAGPHATPLAGYAALPALAVSRSS